MRTVTTTGPFTTFSLAAAAPRRQCLRTASTKPPYPPQSLTLLHKTSSLLPRVLPPDSSRFWNSLLSDAYDEVTSTSPPSARVTVYGVGHWSSSGASELVSALLINPFASDTTSSDNAAIRSRWEGRHQDLVIQQPQQQEQGGSDLFGRLHVQSPYLSSFPLPIQITEIRPPHPHLQEPPFYTPGLPALGEHQLGVLLKADIPIIVCNPLTISVPQLAELLANLAHPNTLVVFTAAAPHPDVVEAIRSLLHRKRHGESELYLSTDGRPRIAFVDPPRALSAIDALESDPASAPAIQRFQSDMVGSRLSSLRDALQRVFTSLGGDGTSGAIWKLANAHARVESALVACRAAVEQAEDEVQRVRERVRDLRDRVEETRVKAHRRVLFFQLDGDSMTTEKGTKIEAVEAVGKALAEADREISAVMRRLTWWRLVWQVDEIGSIVGDAVRRLWCGDLERHLIFHAGRLAARRDDFVRSTHALLDSIPPNSALASSILRNSIAQVDRPMRGTDTAAALVAPILARRAQLAQQPTTYLHRAAQRAVLGMGGGAAVGAGVCWAAVAGTMSDVANGGTTAAAAVLGALAGVRWGIGMWERGVGRWWADWRRVGEGLGRDLETVLKTSVDETVRVAERGCEGLEELIQKRENEVEDIKDEVKKLEDELEENKKELKA